MVIVLHLYWRLQKQLKGILGIGPAIALNQTSNMDYKELTN
jgi:Holliday junction resolvasome RuvABC DNA-binding subunit